jgi:hypothetical protein
LVFSAASGLEGIVSSGRDPLAQSDRREEERPVVMIEMLVNAQSRPVAGLDQEQEPECAGREARGGGGLGSMVIHKREACSAVTLSHIRGRGCRQDQVCLLIEAVAA